MRHTRLLLCVLVTLAPLTARADRITLRDGTLLSGTVKQVDGGFEVVGDNGVKRFVPSADIKSIKIDNTGKLDESAARDRFESLRRSSENERDAARAVDRYETLVSLIDGTAAGAEAKKELDVWRDRRDRKMARIGKAWLTPAEHDALYGEIAGRADAIRAALAANDLARASALLREATPLDPDNVSTLYLTGVLQYRRGQFAEAKKSFDQIAEQIADHPPTLVNQAVLLVRFKRWPQAATALDAAMAAAPENGDILDNVTEFLQLIPEANRKSNVVERLSKRYAVQEASLEQRMEREHKLYRWGSRWVDEKTLAEFKKQRDEHEQLKRDMAKEYDEGTARVRQLDDDARRTNTMIGEIERDALIRDDSGKVFQRSYPQAYWDLKRDLEILAGRRREEVAKLDALKKKAEQVEKSSPSAPYRGTLEPIGERGVPILLPAIAATRPTPEASPPPPTSAPSGGAFIPYRDAGPATQP